MLPETTGSLVPSGLHLRSLCRVSASEEPYKVSFRSEGLGQTPPSGTFLQTKVRLHPCSSNALLPARVNCDPQASVPPLTVLLALVPFSDTNTHVHVHMRVHSPPQAGRLGARDMARTGPLLGSPRKSPRPDNWR